MRLRLLAPFLVRRSRSVLAPALNHRAVARAVPTTPPPLALDLATNRVLERQRNVVERVFGNGHPCRHVRFRFPRNGRC